MGYIFYDTETTGTHTAFDQILQFAAIKTDDELNILDRFNVSCRLLPHIVPSPGAMLVTGVAIDDLLSRELSHYEMMRRVYAKITDWSKGGAIFAGWNSMRFDEALLRQAYYQNLLPVYQTNTNGNGRADIMRVAQAVTGCRPNTLAVPIVDDGRSVFKLGAFATANGIKLDNAHEALADTGATLGIARLIKKRAPDIWHALMANARKSAVQRLIEQQRVLLLAENYFSTAYNIVVTPVAPMPGNPNQWGVFDLQFDPEDYLEADDEDLRAAINGRQKAIRTVSLNAQPVLLPGELIPESVRGGRLSLEAYHDRAKRIVRHKSFRERVAQLLADRYEEQPPSVHVEEQIYDGFPSQDDKGRMVEFHRSDWLERPPLIRKLQDNRYKTLGHRLVAIERPDLLSSREQLKWDDFLLSRLFAERDVPWLTVAAALQQVADLSRGAAPSDRRKLSQLRAYLTRLAD